MRSPFSIRHFSLAISALFLLFAFQSCYSVRFAAPYGNYTPSLTPEGYGDWRGKKITTIDTTVTKGDFTLYGYCEDGFYMVEYKVTMGYVLLNAVTLGKVKKVKVKCNCIQSQN